MIKKTYNNKITNIKSYKLAIITSFSLLTVLSLVTGFYVSYINSADFDLTIWPEYITNEQYRRYSDEYNYKINSVYFENNESLTSKLNTTSYDVMTPTDYAALSFAINNQIIKLDKNNLQAEWDNWLDNNIIDSWVSLFYSNSLSSDDYLLLENEIKSLKNDYETFIKKYIPQYIYEQKKLVNNNFFNNYNEIWNSISKLYEIDNHLLSDYAVPYQMGDIKIVYNLTDPIVQKMFVERPDLIGSYKSIEYITYENNGTLLATKNMRDFISLGLKSTGHSVNDYSDKAISDTYNYLSKLMPNTLLQHDDLARTAANLDAWSVGYAFSGDFVMGIMDEWNYEDINWYDAMLFTKPNEGSVIYFDTIVQGLDLSKQNITDSFINFLSRPDTQSGSGEYGSSYYGGVDYIYYAPSNKYVYEGNVHDEQGYNTYQYFCADNGVTLESKSFRYVSPEIFEQIYNNSTDKEKQELSIEYNFDYQAIGKTINLTTSKNYYSYSNDYVISNNLCYNPSFKNDVYKIFSGWDIIPSDQTINRYFMSPNYTNLYYQALIIETDLDGTDKQGNNINIDSDMLFNRPYPINNPKSANDNWTYDEMYIYDYELIKKFSILYNDLLALQNLI